VAILLMLITFISAIAMIPFVFALHGRNVPVCALLLFWH
jgi:hypothetical protein